MFCMIYDLGPGVKPQDDRCGIMTCGYLSVPRFCPKITAFEFACYIYNHKYKNKFLYFGLYRLPIKSVIFYGFLFLLSRHTGEGRYLLCSCFFGFGGMQWAPTFVGVTHPPIQGDRELFAIKKSHRSGINKFRNNLNRPNFYQQDMRNMSCSKYLLFLHNRL